MLKNETDIFEIKNMIYFIRSHKVMLDSDFAKLYQVETKRLNEQVKRNITQFPSDFMFQLKSNEFLSLKSQFATSMTVEEVNRSFLMFLLRMVRPCFLAF